MTDGIDNAAIIGDDDVALGKPTVAPTNVKTSLVRALGPIDATMIVMGSMIGSGIFITSAESARLIGAPGWLLLAWGVAGLMTITGALCCAELATMMPRAGGVYVFLREAYGAPLGDRKSTRLNSSHITISYAVFCLKKKKKIERKRKEEGE